MISIYIDGSSIGNPGKSGIGYLIYNSGVLVKKDSVYLGIQSNNFAEYMALIFSLVDVIDMGEKKCEVFSDSQLLCEQIKGNFKVKSQNIYSLFVLAKKMISKLGDFSITHIDREKNKDADELARMSTGFLV